MIDTTEDLEDPRPGFPMNWWDKRDMQNKTAFHHAVLKKDVTMVRELLALGASPDVKAMDDMTPLHYACKQRGGDAEIEIAKIILDDPTGLQTLEWQTYKHKKIDSNQSQSQSQDDSSSSSSSSRKLEPGYTALQYAIKAENLIMVSLLLSYGASIELPGYVSPDAVAQNNDDNENDDYYRSGNSISNICPPRILAEERKESTGSAEAFAILQLIQQAEAKKAEAEATASSLNTKISSSTMATHASFSAGTGEYDDYNDDKGNNKKKKQRSDVQLPGRETVTTSAGHTTKGKMEYLAMMYSILGDIEQDQK
jgi:ankyrin repeat protein